MEISTNAGEIKELRCQMKIGQPPVCNEVLS